MELTGTSPKLECGLVMCRFSNFFIDRLAGETLVGVARCIQPSLACTRIVLWKFLSKLSLCNDAIVQRKLDHRVACCDL